MIAVIVCADMFSMCVCVCVCVRVLVPPVMDTIDFGLHGANDSPKAAAQYETHSQMPHESHHALKSRRPAAPRKPQPTQRVLFPLRIM